MTAEATKPATFNRRSFVYRKLEPAGARFAAVKGAAIAMEVHGGIEAEVAAARRMAIADLCPLPRTGFKGRGTIEWIEAQGAKVPPEPNRALDQDDGGVVARLSQSELLILADLHARSSLDERLNSAWGALEMPAKTARGFPVPRQDSHLWFAVTGDKSPAMFAKMCGVDLRPDKFADGCVAQTSVARLSAIVIRHDLDTCQCFYLLADSASAAYLWDCVVDAMAEFDGRVIGLGALRSLAV